MDLDGYIWACPGRIRNGFFIRASTLLSTEFFTYAHWWRLQHNEEQQREEQ
jgi:hypothetical protein